MSGSANGIQTGRLSGIGVGPGDPELLTLTALRLLRAADVIAYPCKEASGGIARAAAEPHFQAHQTLLPMVYPLTASGADRADYEVLLARFYDETSEAIAAHLRAGRNVAVLCEGDPFLYGSFMYWHARLKDRFTIETVPGVSSVMAGPVAAGTPLTVRDDALSVLPGTLPEDRLADALRSADAAIVMKLGRTWPKVRRALERSGTLDRAVFVERASQAGERVTKAADVTGRPPYFSIVVVPSRRPTDREQPARETVHATQSSLTVLGLGPGSAAWLTPEARTALESATDWVGYETYLDMAAELVGGAATRHASPNRVEVERAAHALDLTAKGKRVAVISSGDPGVFGMSAAVLEAIEAEPERWADVDLAFLPGVSAMQAAGARAGAPLGHDFAVVSLSDILKPLSAVLERVEAAARSGLALAFYNPASRTRRDQLNAVLDRLKTVLPAETPVLHARSVGRTGEDIVLTTLAALNPGTVDMKSLLIVGARHSRTVHANGRDWLLTPRRLDEADAAPRAEAAQADAAE